MEKSANKKNERINLSLLSRKLVFGLLLFV